ncbi:MAG: hypothetical protein ACTHJR_11595 [Sphingomonas sp.]|uniref:hypothetical protein n=1 Tax=Sphingomonas sp. TaxID=28214 RepID=UPI003F7F6F0A
MATTSTPSLYQAAEIVQSAECTALQSVLTALTNFNSELDTIDATLNLPPNMRSDAKRIITDLKMQIQFRLETEVPSLIEAATPPAQPAE